MTAPETHEAQDRLRIGFALDRLWCETTGLIEGDSKERPLRLVAELLEREGVPYALIGGVAVQLHTVEPRSTLDIDVAVPRFDDVPRRALLEAGFEHTGRHAHSDNWRAPGEGLLAARVAGERTPRPSLAWRGSGPSRGSQPRLATRRRARLTVLASALEVRSSTR